MRITVLILAFLVPALIVPLAAQESPVKQVLLQQQAAWNRHDLEAFMAGYWNSPELTFFGAKKTSGWQATLDRYRKSLPGRRPRDGEAGVFQLEDRSARSRRSIRSRQLEADAVRREDSTWIIHADIS